MKGLFVKDLRLILKQKTTLVMWFALAVFFVVLNQDVSFGVGYSMFMIAILLVSTVAYDDFDNGMGFLMTLPVTRKIYALEKYVFVIAGTFCAGALATVMGIVYVLNSQVGAALDELFITAALMFLISILYASVMLPVQLKYGAEKGRIIMLILAGVVFLVILVKDRAGEFIQQHMGDFFAIFAVSELQPVDILIVLTCVTVILASVSAMISVRILKKEEY